MFGAGAAIDVGNFVLAADMEYADWSQIEYRFIAHYATGDGSEDIRERYIKDPQTDYHKELQELTKM